MKIAQASYRDNRNFDRLLDASGPVDQVSFFPFLFV